MFVFLCFTLFTFGAADTAQNYQSCDPEPTCQENEHYVQESATSQKTCLNTRQPDTAEACQPFTGCDCDDGFVRLYDDATGPCVLKSECDYLKCNGDLNATYKQCPWACPSTCDAPDAISVCKKMCPRAGCECKLGYIRSENGGYCIRPEDCPGGDPCRGNQTFAACKAGCPTNYCPVNDRRAMIACSPPYPCPPGCVCKSSHLRLSSKDESCVLTSDCPKVKCTRPNEEWNPCTSNCLAESCSDIGNNNSNCRPYYCQPKCACKEGFYRNQSDICIPAVGCLCQENEQYVQNSTVCQKTCGSRLVSGGLESCDPFTGCTCSEGFVRPYDNATGTCIPVNECAPIPTNCGYNEEPTSCKAICPPQSCAIAYTEYMCPERQCEPGCNCIENHLRNSSEICILNDDCPPPQPIEPECGANEESTDCEEFWSYETCDSDNDSDTGISTENECTPGCKCVDNYVRDNLGICIPREELLPENEHYVENSTECQKTCGNRLVRYAKECSPYTGYVCDDGYVHLYDNATGPCIPVTDCAPIPTKCGYNEEPTSCKAICPPQSCASIYTMYMCLERQCEPGCNCIENHLRNSSQICILNDDCPPPQPWPENERYVQNSTERQNTCGNRLVSRYVDETPSYTGFVCDDGYVRLYDNATGPCIPVTDCAPIPTKCGYNEEPTSCKAICPPQSCAIAYTEYMCPERQCEPGCNCIENHLRNSSEICILNDDCPPQQSENSIKKILLSLDKAVMLLVVYFIAVTSVVGSSSTQTYLPDGNPCGANGTLSDCSFRCPNQNCPEDDSRVTILCKPGRPCPPGCMCKQDYLRISSQDDTCVLARDCPKINCTRQNEIWDSCSSECLAEKCEDMYKPNPCNAADNPGCKPRCVCAKGHFRDENDSCVPHYTCPNYITTTPPSTTTEPCPATDQNSDSSSDSSSWSSSDSDCTEYRKPRLPQCIRTCAEPKPKNCKGAPRNYCKDGYILSKRGGKCIKIENCPKDIGCNGDKNAVVKACPLSCPPTCMNPNYDPCKKQCDPVGCECQPGYLLSKDNGKCILPDDCKGGNPCGPNATYVPCKSGCPTNYCPVDDRRGRIICETYPFSPCYPGCACQYNHKIKSREDPRCILSQECPKVNCTRPYEEWSSCPFACLAESCDDVDSQPSTCNTFVFNCDPKCICIKNHFRNSSDICIPANKCPRVAKTTVQ